MTWDDEAYHSTSATRSIPVMSLAEEAELDRPSHAGCRLTGATGEAAAVRCSTPGQGALHGVWQSETINPPVGLCDGAQQITESDSGPDAHPDRAGRARKDAPWLDSAEGNPAMALRIEDYAMLGDTQSVALVGTDGSIDWLCLPRFDSGAVFAALLGTEEHGRWLITPVGDVRAVRRRYRPETLVLETELETAEGTVRLIDFMPPRGEAPDVVRIVEGVSGRVSVRMELRLRFDYGRVVPWVRRAEGALVAVAGPDSCWLRTPVETRGEDLATVAEFVLEQGDRVPFVLTWRESHLSAPKPVNAEHALVQTEQYWREWLTQCTYDGAVEGSGGPLLDHAEGVDLRSYRRDRRSADDVPA